MRVTCAWLALQLMPALAWAATYHVAPGGSGNGSASNPWGTIAAAVGSSSPVAAGDIIMVKAGTYSTGSIEFGRSGAPGNPITLKADGAVVVKTTGTFNWAGTFNLRSLHDWVIDGFRIESSPDWGIALHACSDITIQNCTLYKPAASGIAVTGVNFSPGVSPVQSKNIKVLGNTIENANATSPNQEGLSLAGVDGFEVARNKLIDCRHEGIDAKNGSRNGSIHHNEIVGQMDIYPGTGMGVYIDAWNTETFNIDVHSNLVRDSEEGVEINCEDCKNGGATAGVHDVRVYNNLIVNSNDPSGSGWKGRGMSFYNFGAGSRVTKVHVFNNTIVGCKNAGIFVDNADVKELFLRNNIIVNNNPDVVLNAGGAIVVENNIHSKAIQNKVGATLTANQIADPRLVNPAGLDLHLQATSPAIDAATATDVPAVDFDGVSRPQGPASDIGAFEFPKGSPPRERGSAELGPPAGDGRARDRGPAVTERGTPASDGPASARPTDGCGCSAAPRAPGALLACLLVAGWIGRRRRR